MVVTKEMIHEARVISLERNTDLGPKLTQWLGDSRGRWEGDTLVVEVSNLSGQVDFRGASKNLRLIERYRRIDPETIEYRVTIDDPSTWTKPWTMSLSMKKDDEQYKLVEYLLSRGELRPCEHSQWRPRRRKESRAEASQTLKGPRITRCCAAPLFRRCRVAVGLLVLALLFSPALGVADAADANYHHVHLTVTNGDVAAQWYIDHMGCKAVATQTDAAQCGDVQLLFIPRPAKGGNEGTAADHISFSVADLAAKIKQLLAIGVAGFGVRIMDRESPIHDEPGLFKTAFVKDPWGTKIELVEDPERLGFHHVHLVSAEPKGTLKCTKHLWWQAGDPEGTTEWADIREYVVDYFSEHRQRHAPAHAGAYDRPHRVRIFGCERGRDGAEEEGG